MSATDNDVYGFSDHRMVKSSQEYRDMIQALQDEMIQMKEDGDTMEFPVVHHFAPGVYAREMHLIAGGAIVSKIHKHPCLNIVSAGKLIVVTEEGRKYIEAPYTFTSPGGIKRAGYVIEDTIWTTIHVTDETDLEKIEAEVIAIDYAELDSLQTGIEELEK